MTNEAAPAQCECTCGKSGCASKIPRGDGSRGGVGVRGVPHGSVKRYERLACRCELCAAAKAQKGAELSRRRRNATADYASKRGQQWTGAEMEVLLRGDLTLTEMALMLGRSYAAVSVARQRSRKDPKWLQVIRGRVT